ncbi:MAG: cytoplasmic protein [Pseudomonadota bacterium]
MHDPTLKAAHDRSTYHRAEIEASAICGCFYCCSEFEPNEIGEWVDAPDGGAPGQNASGHVASGQTALCPRCGVDAVIGSRSGFPITAEFLAQMRARWFGGAG